MWTEKRERDTSKIRYLAEGDILVEELKKKKRQMDRGGSYIKSVKTIMMMVVGFVC